MYTPSNQLTKTLLKELYCLVIEKGKMIPLDTWSDTGKLYKTYVGGYHSHTSHKRFGLDFLKRNKRQTGLLAGSVVVAGVTSGGVGILVGVPIALAGYGIKKGIIAGIRRPKYKFIRKLLSEMENTSTESFVNLLSEMENPDEALTKLMYWFRHKHDSNISAMVEQIKDVRRAYEGFKTESTACSTKGIKTCDGAAKLAERMLIYLACLNAVEDSADLFTGCYLYVDETIRRINEEFDSQIRSVLRQIYVLTDTIGTPYHRQKCSKSCCYSAHGGKGKNYYSHSKSLRENKVLMRLLQDAAHSRKIFGHGGKDRSEWIKEVLGIQGGDTGRFNYVDPRVQEEETGVSFGDELQGGLGSVTETTLGLPLDLYSGNIMGNLAGKWIDSERLGQSFAKQFDFKDGISEGLYKGLVGGDLGIIQTVGAAVVEVANDLLNKYQLTHRPPLSEKSIKHNEGINRLDILRANLKGGILEGWVDSFKKVEKYHQEFMAIKGRIDNCSDAFNITFAALARQYHLVQFLGAHNYVKEFHDGVIRKMARMTVRWSIMADRTVRDIDMYMQSHSLGDLCERDDSVFCYLPEAERGVSHYIREVKGGGNAFEGVWNDLNIAIDTAGFKNPEKWSMLD